MTAQILDLPTPSTPGGAYRPVIVHQGLAYVSGQLPKRDDVVQFVGKVGDTVDIETARQAARLCARQCLAALEQALGDLAHLERLLKVTGFVACTPDFGQQPKVVDGASEYFIETLGARGEHARSAIGVLALPRGASVEIELIAALKA